MPACFPEKKKKPIKIISYYCCEITDKSQRLNTNIYISMSHSTCSSLYIDTEAQKNAKNQ